MTDTPLTCPECGAPLVIAGEHLACRRCVYVTRLPEHERQRQQGQRDLFAMDPDDTEEE